MADAGGQSGMTSRGRIYFYLVHVVVLAVTLPVAHRSPAWRVEYSLVLAAFVIGVAAVVDRTSRVLHHKASE